MIKEKKFYGVFAMLCLPIVLQKMVTLGVNLADNLMLGRYGEASLSGVTAVNQIQFIYQQILMGAGDGMIILAAQYYGQRKMKEMKQVAAVAMRIALIVMALLFALVSLFPEQAVGLFLPRIRRSSGKE